MCDFLRDDCRELARRGLLSPAQQRAWETTLADGDAAARAALVPQLRALFHSEVDALVECLRVAQNEQHEQTLQHTDIMAVAAGGLLGALNAWMRPAAPAPAVLRTATSASAPSLWASAFDAAQASLNVVRQRRLLDHLQIHHVSGDESRADRVLLCVNGFMTQGGDPSRNWAAWAPSDDARTVLYAVQWEAGDARAWNDFCAHAHDNIKGVASSSSAAHDLLTHFTGNPWHKARDKAEQVGILLAQVLAAKPTFLRGRLVTLMGHSLGGAVIHSTLQELSRMRRDGRIPVDEPPFVHSALLFAAAFVPGIDTIQTMLTEIARDGRLINVFSQRDEVLTKLFWAIQLHGGDPVAVGCAPLSFPSGTIRGVNVEVSDLVPPRMPNQFGHSYGPHMDQIRTRILPHLTFN